MLSKQLEPAENQRYKDFFSIIKKHIDDTRKRRLRGVNDYNVFTALLSAKGATRLPRLSGDLKQREIIVIRSQTRVQAL